MIEHISVMMEQVLDGLSIKADGVYWDGTFGGGGHSSKILEALSEQGRLIGSDRDLTAMARSERFAGDARFTFLRGAISKVVDEIPEGIDGFLWDLGVSTMQIKDPERGFAFMADGPLDMRMDTADGETAADLVNSLPEKELADLIYKYGEERLSRRIARLVVLERKEKRIEDTATLADICRRAYPRKRHRIDPATRTFQALRIAVNGELDEIESSIPKALAKLAPGGRAVIISFHSLEDRIVKHTFREFAKTGPFQILTKKPLIPTDEETHANPAARSAKLRVLARTGGDES